MNNCHRNVDGDYGGRLFLSKSHFGLSPKMDQDESTIKGIICVRRNKVKNANLYIELIWLLLCCRKHAQEKRTIDAAWTIITNKESRNRVRKEGTREIWSQTTSSDYSSSSLTILDGPST